jgi:hypothetical protein
MSDRPGEVTMEFEEQDRLERLSESVSKLRARGKIDVDRAQLIAGAVALVLGLLLIVFGWYGAANTPYIFEQVPYMISGGLLGLGLLFVGGFVYFSYWVTRLVRESRSQADRAEEALLRIEVVLQQSSNGSAPTPSPSRGRSRAAKSPSKPYVATKDGAMFHLEGCSVIAGRPGLRRVGANTDLEPCRLCDPLSVVD